MRPETRDAVDGYWAASLGCAPGALRTDGVSVVAGNEGTAAVVVRGDAAVVAVDPERLAVARDVLSETALSELTDPERIRARFERLAAVGEILGPAYLGYADESTVRAAAARTDRTDAVTRPLTAADEAAYDAFEAACPPTEWSDGGPPFSPTRTVGRFVDGDLVALAGYEVWDGTLAHIAVVTHPDRRGEGHAQAVVAAVARRTLDGGLVPQYRTLDAWPWSVRVAEKVGFERWGTSVLVRFES